MERRGFFQRFFSPPQVALPRSSDEPADNTVRRRQSEPVELFDQFGRTGETIVEHLTSFETRLAELETLRQDFGSLRGPVHDFVDSHAQAQATLAKTEALFGHARRENEHFRTEAAELRRLEEESRNQLAQLRESYRVKEETLEERDDQLKSLRSLTKENQAKLDWQERQIQIETDKGEALGQTNLRLSNELDAVEQQLATERARAVEFRDATSLAEAEALRLRESLDRLQPLYNTSKRRLLELETELQIARQAMAAVELKFASEREGRQIAEELREQDRLASENEIAFLVMQNEALGSKHATTVKLLEQARSVVSDKTDEARANERAAKEAAQEKFAAERRVIAAQDEVRRLSGQLEASAQSLQETGDRCAMLTKALAAKDVQIAQLTAKTDTLSKQGETAAQRHEVERGEQESAYRKLIEDLEREKAERALAQGALTIARASRERLIDQLEALKRRRHHGIDEAGSEQNDETEHAKPDNVHAFRSPESTLDK